MPLVSQRLRSRSVEVTARCYIERLQDGFTLPLPVKAREAVLAGLSRRRRGEELLHGAHASSVLTVSGLTEHARCVRSQEASAGRALCTAMPADRTCNGRGFVHHGAAMAGSAAHLVDRLLPEVSVREWGFPPLCVALPPGRVTHFSRSFLRSSVWPLPALRSSRFSSKPGVLSKSTGL